MSCTCTRPAFKAQNFKNRLVLFRGVLRRFYLYFFRPGYIKASIANRKGECTRCGTCCNLILKRGCPSLDFEPSELSLCKIHGSFRMPNCINFPIDTRDIADRDLVAPDGVKCGFRFE